MSTYQFGDVMYTMPLDMLERKYYAISADCRQIGPQLSFGKLIQSMKDNYDKQSDPPKCSGKDVLPTNFLRNSLEGWNVPFYQIDEFTITFYTNNGPSYDNFVADINKKLIEYRKKRQPPRTPPPVPPPPQQYQKPPPIPTPPIPPPPIPTPPPKILFGKVIEQLKTKTGGRRTRKRRSTRRR
jgi:hypothetical protein